MYSKKISRWNLTFVISALLLIAVSQVQAGNEESKAATSSIGNFGFMKKPPLALRKKFPMCDAFLHVKWINKKKRIGYAHYAARRGYFNMPIKKAKRSVWALIDLDEASPSFALDIHKYKQQGRMDQLLKLVMDGEPQRVHDLFVIKYRGTRTAFYEPFYPVLSDFTQTVCIAFPDRQRAWIVEGESVQNALNRPQKDQLAAELKRSELPKPFSDKYAASHGLKSATVPFAHEWFESLWVLDLNFDGAPDLAFDWPTRASIVYSVRGTYYQMARAEIRDIYGKLEFPPSHSVCELRPWPHRFFITTDGSTFDLNNQCNLTELTSPSGKE